MSSSVNQFTCALDNMAEIRPGWNRRYLGNVG